MHSSNSVSLGRDQNASYSDTSNAQSILEELIRRNDDVMNNIKSHKSKITLLQVNTEINNLSRQNKGRSNTTAAELAQSILENMEELEATVKSQQTRQNKITNMLIPNEITYNSVLNCWAKSNGGIEAAQNAEDIFNKMVTRYENSLESGEKLDVVIPDVISFHSVLHAWAKSGAKDSGERAQILFDKMTQMAHLKQDAPTAQTYAILIDAWASSSSRSNAERATNILNEIIHTFTTADDEDSNILTSAAFNSVMKAWANCGKGAHAALQAEKVLQQMEDLANQRLVYTTRYENFSPNTITYNYLLDAWSKSRSKNTTKKVETILKKMHKLHDEGKEVRPNRFSYTIVINALAKSKEKKAADRAEKILNKMIKLYGESHHDMKPSTVTFNAVIDAWARNGGMDAGKRAEAILNNFIELASKRYDFDMRPDSTTFNSAITAWARSGNRYAGERAEELITRMQYYEDVYPDVVTFNALISAYGNGRNESSISLAESVIDRMEELDEEDATYARGIVNVRPNRITYNSLIGVYGKSNVTGKAKKAEEIFHQLSSNQQREMRPNIITYSSLWKACAQTRNPKEKVEALSIAMKAFEHFKNSKDVAPNNVTYRVLIDTAFNLIKNKEEQYDFLDKVLIHCQKNGCLDKVIQNKVRKVLPVEYFMKIQRNNNN